MTLYPNSHTNCYLIGHRRALVVDPGTSVESELRHLRRELWRLRGSGGTVQAILLTHHHQDHVSSACQIGEEMGVPIAAHPDTLSRLQIVRSAIEVVDRQLFQTDPTLNLLGLHTPGHTPGHLCLFEPRRRYLFSGDMVPGVGTTLIDPSDGDMALYLESLGRLAALEPSTILPGHGPILREGAGAIRRLIEHRLWREDRVLKALSFQPKNILSIMRLAYSDTSPLLWPLACRSTISHLRKLQQERRASLCAGGRWVRGADPA